MVISLTRFKSVFDNKTHNSLQFESFDQFEQALRALSEKPCADKKHAYLISPATYVEGTTRANRNVVEWSGWAAVDVDDHIFEGDLEDELRTRYGKWRYVCYSTASSTESRPKFRLVFPLTRVVQQDQIKHFWWALNSELGAIGDRQTKDLSRMYYIPASYAGAYNFFFTNSGDPLDVDFLCSKWEYNSKSDAGSFIDRLPDEWQRQIVEHRKSQLENTSFQWSGYRDCPFWPKKLASEYQTISNTGWYHKMYQIMVAVAGTAVKNQYPITANEITNMCREFDMDTGNWYENRPMNKEADRALEYVYRNI